MKKLKIQRKAWPSNNPDLWENALTQFINTLGKIQEESDRESIPGMLLPSEIQKAKYFLETEITKIVQNTIEKLDSGDFEE